MAQPTEFWFPVWIPCLCIPSLNSQSVDSQSRFPVCRFPVCAFPVWFPVCSSFSFSSSCLLHQSAADTPTTPKLAKDQRDLFFPSSVPLLSHAPAAATVHPPPANDSSPLAKLSRPAATTSSGFHEQPTPRRVAVPVSAAPVAVPFLPQPGTTSCPPLQSVCSRGRQWPCGVRLWGSSMHAL